MGWNRMKSADEIRSESRKQTAQRERIRGFLPFTQDSAVLGKLVAIRVDGTSKGYFVLRAEAPTTVNVRDAESKTGQGVAQPGELVGIRRTGATKRLAELPIGTLVLVTYIGLEERVSFNPKTRQQEAAPYHHLEIDVYSPDNVTTNTEEAA